MNIFIVFLFLFLPFFSLEAKESKSKTEYGDIVNLSLEDLSSISLTNTDATLTKTQIKDIPASITVITQKDILQSGARNLDELLEIYVPSFAYMYKTQGSQMGMRGIISDRNNKILLLVNDKVMNVKASDGGAITERWFSMLGDIKKITVIRGPGSAIYGAGAIAGVIKIETFDAFSKQGLEVKTRVGLVEDFVSAEISYGDKIYDSIGMYIYYGVDKYKGASNDDAPHKFSFDIDNKEFLGWQNIPADTPFPYETVNNNGSFQNNLRHKFHFQLQNDNFTFWSRFTRSSLAIDMHQIHYKSTWIADLDTIKDTGEENQQLSFFFEYRQKVKQNLSIKYDASYVRSDVFIEVLDKNIFEKGDRSWGEDNFMAKVLLNYLFDKNNILAVGSEYNYDKFGRKASIGYAPASKINGLDENTKFDTDIVSIFGEYQLKFLDDYILFVDMRADKHTYSPWMYSPRVNVVYNISANKTLKFGYNRSVRHSDDADLYRYYQENKKNADVEKIDTFEIIFSMNHLNHKFDISLFSNNHNVVAFNDTTKLTDEIGQAHSYGFEAEYRYTKEKLEFYLSHSYTKLSSFDLNEPYATKQNISAMPYGYGDDFANSNDNISKLRLNYKINKKIKWINSLRAFWGYPGSKDLANYNMDTTKAYNLPYYEDNHTRAFEESIYLDSGLLWKINRQTTLTLNGYNLLGLIDEDYNKRNFFQRTTHYRDMAPSISIGLKYILD